jgi:hypothetical protein
MEKVHCHRNPKHGQANLVKGHLVCPICGWKCKPRRKPRRKPTTRKKGCSRTTDRIVEIGDFRYWNDPVSIGRGGVGWNYKL